MKLDDLISRLPTGAEVHIFQRRRNWHHCVILSGSVLIRGKATTANDACQNAMRKFKKEFYNE